MRKWFIAALISLGITGMVLAQEHTPPTIQAILSGNYDFTGQIKAADGTAAAPSLTSASELTLGFWRSASANWRFVGGGLGVSRNALGVTTTPGFTLENLTAAASGAQQYSPGLSQIGQGWKTNATAASQPVETRWEVRPVQGAANPTFNYVLMGRVNNGTWLDLQSIDSTGAISWPQGVADISAAGAFDGTSWSGTSYADIGTSSYFSWGGGSKTKIKSSANGLVQFYNAATALAIELNIGDTAAPTISSGGGTTPAIVTSPPSRNSTGAVNIGTGGTASQIVIAFGSPAWTNAPHCATWVETATAGDIRAHGVTTTTTTMTIQAASAWAGSSIVAWKCEGTI